MLGHWMINTSLIGIQSLEREPMDLFIQDDYELLEKR